MLLETGITHQHWTLDYILQVVDDNLRDYSVGEVIECMNIIRMTFGLPQIYYQMTNGVWEWDYTYPTE